LTGGVTTPAGRLETPAIEVETPGIEVETPGVEIEPLGAGFQPPEIELKPLGFRYILGGRSRKRKVLWQIGMELPVKGSST
jgi:hypothetical protein